MLQIARRQQTTSIYGDLQVPAPAYDKATGLETSASKFKREAIEQHKEALAAVELTWTPPGGKQQAKALDQLRCINPVDIDTMEHPTAEAIKAVVAMNADQAERIHATALEFIGKYVTAAKVTKAELEFILPDVNITCEENADGSLVLDTASILVIAEASRDFAMQAWTAIVGEMTGGRKKQNQTKND